MKTESEIIVNSSAEIPRVFGAFAGEELRHLNDLTQPGLGGRFPNAPVRSKPGGQPAFLFAWSDAGVARKLAAWRRGGINE